MEMGSKASGNDSVGRVRATDGDAGSEGGWKASSRVWIRSSNSVKTDVAVFATTSVVLLTAILIYRPPRQLLKQPKTENPIPCIDDIPTDHTDSQDRNPKSIVEQDPVPRRDSDTLAPKDKKSLALHKTTQTRLAGGEARGAHILEDDEVYEIEDSACEDSACEDSAWDDSESDDSEAEDSEAGDGEANNTSIQEQYNIRFEFFISLDFAVILRQ
ncbi:hypothetical protein S40285_10789 [Stachybotrys chlorohalonatus IBT 40285]|uniref:Uncharacterized protein n=1 Tax=Stachybotrys chlorohalonatus (strain IBT 40285) TaxID=1283841 RepID=A0A084QXG4_STAC4|nr:hypothetical protein S40285_10789 [Stachybotrys chlorohalonata IBT 40285]